MLDDGELDDLSATKASCGPEEWQWDDTLSAAQVARLEVLIRYHSRFAEVDLGCSCPGPSRPVGRPQRGTTCCRCQSQLYHQAA